MALTLLAANNAQTVLAAGINSSATSLTVNSGTGALFPIPSPGGSYFKLTIIDAATGLLTEIVHVTARSGDVMTIERGKEGTTPRAWSANDIAANMMTAGTLSILAQINQSLQISNNLSEISAGGSSAVIASLQSLGLSNSSGYVGRLLGVKTFTTSGTYTPTPGTKSILVQVQGGGGPGGNATSGTGTSATVGSGGGGGGYAESYLTTVPSSAAVVVGAGGVSSSGGNSSFDGTIIANGGAVGTSNAVSGGTPFTGHARSGIGGTATGGNLYNSKGGVGSPAIITQGIPSGGNGGASQLSGSESGAGASGGSGIAGTLGSGGSGAAQPIGAGGFGGGPGGGGIVVIWEYA
ncbi:hypothetical protein ACLH09_05815 [Citrobacter braakii]|uniref:hypothetical protein n=1 Tax=Citrobacter braakii TaxID=57706 RepID=UPI0039844D1C